MGSQKVGHDLATEQQQQYNMKFLSKKFISLYTPVIVNVRSISLSYS